MSAFRKYCQVGIQVHIKKHKKNTRLGYPPHSDSSNFRGGCRLRCGRTVLSELRFGVERIGESSWSAVVDGEWLLDGTSIASSVGGISGCVMFLSRGVAISCTGLDVRGFLDGVVKGTRPSQRDLFEGGVVGRVDVAGPEFGLGK